MGVTGSNGNGNGAERGDDHATAGEHGGVTTKVIGAQLRAVRESLAELHRRLVGAARQGYEREHGRLSGPGELLRLLTQDDHFAWLRGLSELLADIDAVSGEVPTSELLAAVRGAAEAMVQPTQEPQGFWARYSPLLQEFPDVAVAHGQLRQLLGQLPAASEGGSRELRERHEQALAKKRK